MSDPKHVVKYFVLKAFRGSKLTLPIVDASTEDVTVRLFSSAEEAKVYVNRAYTSELNWVELGSFVVAKTDAFDAEYSVYRV